MKTIESKIQKPIRKFLQNNLGNLISQTDLDSVKVHMQQLGLSSSNQQATVSHQYTNTSGRVQQPHSKDVSRGGPNGATTDG